MQEILSTLTQEIKTTKAKDIIEFEAINPDISSSLYNGNRVEILNKSYIYRGYKTWIDLAHLLGCRMLTPLLVDSNFVHIRYEKLNADVSFHTATTSKEEKYGVESIFSEIYKNEEASFLYYYLQALTNANLSKRKRILNLGVNSGEEFETILNAVESVAEYEFVGIDYCASAINAAKRQYAALRNITFIEHDINDLEALNLGKFDLIISIGTLQSSNLAFNALLMSIVQNQLKSDGAMILGFPNCRWIDGEMLYGARVKNYPFSELGLLYKDVIFSKKYLQQKKYRVTITGKDYIFLTATSIRKESAFGL